MGEYWCQKEIKKIIAGIASTVVLITAATTGILYTSEVEVESKKTKGKKNKTLIKTNNPSTKIKFGGNQQDLALLLPDSERNLGTIITNRGDDFVIKQIKDFLIKKNIDDSQVEIIKIRWKMATIKPIVGSVYGGNPIVVYFNSDDRQHLSWVILNSERNLGTIITNGALKPTTEQLKTELAKLQVNTSQVEITNIESTKAVIHPITNSVAYRGNAITVFFSVDSHQNLSTLLSTIEQKKLGTIIITDGSTSTTQQINEQLVKKGIDTSQVEISNISDKTVTIKPIVGSTKYKGNQIILHLQITNNSQDLPTLLPDSERNLGKIYIDILIKQIQTMIGNISIATILSNQYNDWN